MIHEHIKRTFDGFMSTIAAIFFGAVSITAVQSAVSIASGILGAIASVTATVYYINAIRVSRKNKK